MSSYERMRELLERPEFSWLLDRLVSRIERGLALDEGVVSLKDPEGLQRSAIDDLLGRRSSRGGQVSLDLAAFALCLRLSAEEIEDLVVSLRGPVRNRRADREVEAAAWSALFSRWRERLSDRPKLPEWLDDLEATGGLKRASKSDLERADRLLAESFQVLLGVPYDDILIASLAARVTGDSHALDRGRPLALLCLRAVFHLHGIDGSIDADSRREAWAEIGVMVDDLSAPVLCLNLRPVPASAAAEWIEWHVERGEPYFLSWRQAREFDPAVDGGPVYVCENPAIVSEAARRLGRDSKPLICLNGVPSGAVRVLLQRLGRGGVSLRMRADFDWVGLRILDRWMDVDRDIIPWRMTSEDYRLCAPVRPLEGAPVVPEWARDLVTTMESTGLAAYEEELVDVLLEDLRKGEETVRRNIF